MGSTIKQRLRRYNGTDYDTIHLETHSDVVMCSGAGVTIYALNTTELTLGQSDIYFNDYPSIKWQVQHLSGDYVYLALTGIAENTAFHDSGTSYSGSTIAAKCTTYLNNTIPDVADYLEEVTVEGVTAKVFIPSKSMMETNWDWPKASASNRICKLYGTASPYWLSTAYDSSYVWRVVADGSLAGNYGNPSLTFGFRPAVKVNYKQPIGYIPATDIPLTNYLNNLASRITYGVTDLTPGTSELATGNLYFVYE